jgi:hypothetical protein
MFSFANVMDLFTHELARLGRRGLPLSLVLLRSLDRFPFRHRILPLALVGGLIA